MTQKHMQSDAAYQSLAKKLAGSGVHVTADQLEAMRVEATVRVDPDTGERTASRDYYYRWDTFRAQIGGRRVRGSTGFAGAIMQLRDHKDVGQQVRKLLSPAQVGRRSRVQGVAFKSNGMYCACYFFGSK